MTLDSSAPSADRPKLRASDRSGSYPKGDARREEILRGVIELIMRNGYRRQSLREIARSLQIEPAHILYYFASRDELLWRVIELWDSDSTRALAEKMEQPGLDLFVAAVRRNCEAPGIGHLFLSFAADAIDPGHIAHPFFAQRVRRVHADLSAAIDAEQTQGRISPAVDPLAAARQLMALADGLQLQVLLGSNSDAAEDLSRAIRDLRDR